MGDLYTFARLRSVQGEDYIGGAYVLEISTTRQK